MHRQHPTLFRNKRFALNEMFLEMLQNLLYFMYKKTHEVFFHFSFCATLYFSLMNALVYVDLVVDSRYLWTLVDIYLFFYQTSTYGFFT